MPDGLVRRYWDAGVFVAWIKGEANRVQACEGIVREATEGGCELFTSALTLAEVTKDHSGPVAPTEEVQTRIRDFFRNDYVKLVMCDRVIGERARQLMWDYPF